MSPTLGLDFKDRILVKWVRPGSLKLAAFLVGLLFGSFLNVCISRLPKHESIVRTRIALSELWKTYSLVRQCPRFELDFALGEVPGL